MVIDPQITNLIPHRDPFLWVDKIIEETPNSLVAEKHIPVDLDVFRGHYPGNPILPGVLLCEAVFQTGALLIARIISQDDTNIPGVPVITKISSARFKRPVKPESTLRIEVKLAETVSSVYFFKGTVRVNAKVVLRLDFSATLVDHTQEDR